MLSQGCFWNWIRLSAAQFKRLKVLETPAPSTCRTAPQGRARGFGLTGANVITAGQPFALNNRNVRGLICRLFICVLEGAPGSPSPPQCRALRKGSIVGLIIIVNSCFDHIGPAQEDSSGHRRHPHTLTPGAPVVSRAVLVLLFFFFFLR